MRCDNTQSPPRCGDSWPILDINPKQNHDKTSTMLTRPEWLKIKIRTSVGKDVKKLEPVYTVGRIFKWCSYLVRQFGIWVVLEWLL